MKLRLGDMVVLKAILRRMLRERPGLANAGQNGKHLGRLLSAALLPNQVPGASGVMIGAATQSRRHAAASTEPTPATVGGKD